MSILADFTLKYAINIPALKQIRKDWAGIYKTIYHNQEFRDKFDFSKLDNPELVERATKAMEAAGNYQPHQTIAGPVESASNLLSILKIISLTISVFLGITLFGIFELVLSLTSFIESVVYSLFPIEIYVIGAIYFYLLSVDKEFLQGFNKEIRFGPGKIAQADRQSEKLFSYYLWNNNLCDNKMAVTLMILLVIRMGSEGVYQRIMRILKTHPEKFIEIHSFRKSWRMAYILDQNQKQ